MKPLKLRKDASQMSKLATLKDDSATEIFF